MFADSFPLTGLWYQLLEPLLGARPLANPLIEPTYLPHNFAHICARASTPSFSDPLL